MSGRSSKNKRSASDTAHFSFQVSPRNVIKRLQRGCVADTSKRWNLGCGKSQVHGSQLWNFYFSSAPPWPWGVWPGLLAAQNQLPGIRFYFQDSSNNSLSCLFQQDLGAASWSGGCFFSTKTVGFHSRKDHAGRKKKKSHSRPLPSLNISTLLASVW